MTIESIDPSSIDPPLLKLNDGNPIRNGGKRLNMRIKLIEFLSRDDRGASMVEYALLVVLIALVALVAVQLAGNSLSSTYGDIASTVGAT